MSDKPRALTQGEQTIWAAMYVLHLQRSFDNKPRHITLPNNTEEDEKQEAEWYAGQAVSAAECAFYAVDYLRDSLPAIAEGFDDTSDVYLAAKGMTT